MVGIPDPWNGGDVALGWTVLPKEFADGLGEKTWPLVEYVDEVGEVVGIEAGGFGQDACNIEDVPVRFESRISGVDGISLGGARGASISSACLPTGDCT